MWFPDQVLYYRLGSGEEDIEGEGKVDEDNEEVADNNDCWM